MPPASYAAFASFLNRHAGKITLLVATGLFLLVWHATFIHGAIFPYDYQTADYPGYITALRAARFSLFSIYDPFVDAGQVGPNLIASFDPPGWLPLFGRALPSYFGLQTMMLAHLLLIPLGLLLVAWANRVPRSRWIAIAPISMAAYAMGPTLKYAQHTNAIVSLGYLALLFGALEAFRRNGSLHFAILAALAAAYSTEQWFYATIFLPIPLLAYGLVNFRELTSTRKRVFWLITAACVALVVTVPSVMLDVHLDRTIEIARHLDQLNEITLQQATAIFGAPLISLPLVAIPSAILALAVLGLRTSSALERWIYGITIAVLFLYGFGDVTQFGPVFRRLYPLAGAIRRPYATWYVLLPFILFLAAKGLRAPAARPTQIVAAVGAIAVAIAVVRGESGSILAVAVVASTLVVMFVRPTLVVISAAIVVQWIAIDWGPFRTSQWAPNPIASSLQYFAPYEGLRSILPFESSTSSNAFRIVNVGLPAEFGPSAGAFKIYNVAADYNTAFPHELVRELGTDQLHATTLPQYFIEHSDAFADERWKRLAVRYYIFPPAVFSALPRGMLSKPGLRVVPVPSYWKVVEDTHAAPFVSAIEDDGLSVPVETAMTRDSFRLNVPNGARLIRFAQHYDSWWKAHDSSGKDLSSAIRDDGGQLAFDGATLGGRAVVLRYTDPPTVLALVLSLLMQLTLIIVYPVGLILAALRRRVRRDESSADTVSAAAEG